MIGPYCVVGADVVLGENCELLSHVVLGGPTKIGDNNRVFPFTTLGLEPQDLKFKGEKTRLEIGDNNIIRESVTIHRGTPAGGGITRVGSNCLIMAYTHIAHDCMVAERDYGERCNACRTRYSRGICRRWRAMPGTSVRKNRRLFVHWRRYNHHSGRLTVLINQRKT